jgi:D-serine deaminase-like pyridoxal phosphate-dependent protein
VRLKELTTPAALVDLEVFERNCAAMRTRIDSLGVRLRPHVKTHKTVEGALVQCGGAPAPITVATLAEARFFAAAGFTDIVYAVPIAPAKVAPAAELLRSGVELTLVFDNEVALRALEANPEAHGLRFPAMLKVDCGYHRAGVDPEHGSSVALAAALATSPRLAFRGILTHAGHAYHCRNVREIGSVARQERDVMLAFASRLRAAGIEVREVSLGSTPTMSVIDELAGVSEARPGNYVFFDAFQAAIGACRLDDCAFTVLAAVIGCYPQRRQLVIDAGALALSKDEGARHIDPELGYGAVFSADRARHFWELRVATLSQEHGVVDVNSPRSAEEFPLGTLVRIVPNHSCLSAAMFDRYRVVRRDEVVAEWRPVRGW